MILFLLAQPFPRLLAFVRQICHASRFYAREIERERDRDRERESERKRQGEKEG